MDMCRVENKDSKDFTAKFENNKFTIKKNTSAIVPRAAVNLWFGDPDTRDNKGNDRRYQERNAEYQRMRIKYGVYDDVSKWNRNTPKVRVYDLEDNRLTTVVEDPEGKTLDHHAQLLPSPLEQDMAQQMADMERQLEAMRRAMADAQAGEAGGMGRTPTEGQAKRSGKPEVDAPDTDDSASDADPDANTESDPGTPTVQAGVVEDKPTRVRGGSSKS